MEQNNFGFIRALKRRFTEQMISVVSSRRGCVRACVFLGFLFISLLFTRQFCWSGEGRLFVWCKRLSLRLIVFLSCRVVFWRSFAFRSFSCSCFGVHSVLVVWLGRICCIIIYVLNYLSLLFIINFKVWKCVKTQRVPKLGGFTFAMWTKSENKIHCYRALFLFLCQRSLLMSKVVVEPPACVPFFVVFIKLCVVDWHVWQNDERPLTHVMMSCQIFFRKDLPLT